MLTLAEMQARFAQPGQVKSIWLRPARGAALVSIDDVAVTEAGLQGDRARKGKRAITLLQAEHVQVIAELAGIDALEASLLRRNVLVAGLNLAAFRGKTLRLGTALIELTVPCHPCSQMEKLLGHGGYTAMRGHGGMCASVIEPGRLTLGDQVVPCAE